MKKLLFALPIILLAGCSSMPTGGMSSGNRSGPESFDATEPWTPNTAVPTQRTFNPNDLYHGG